MLDTVAIVDDAATWDAVLGFCACDLLDVFHLYAYVDLEAARLDGRAILLWMRLRGRAFALPLVLRDIPGHPGLCDATAAYGYNGCVYQGEVDDATREAVADGFAQALDRAGCVSVFNRGHPFIPPLLPAAVKIGETLYVDLAAGEAAYDAGLSDGHRYEIRKLRGMDIRLEVDREGRHVAEFHRIYIETMTRRGAGPAYHFTVAYFARLLTCPEFGGELRLAWVDGRLVAGAMFLRHGRTAHYHFSSSVIGALKFPAIKLVIDDFIRSEIRHGRADRLHLGGGLGASQDSLNKFKRGFAAKPVPHHQSRWVIRPEDYRRLSAGRPDTGFFPLYRAPA